MKSALGSVTDVTKQRLVTPAKQRRDPCPGSPTDWVVFFEFPFSLVGKSTVAFPTGQWRIQGKDPGPPLFLDQQKFFGDTGPHTPPPPPLSQSLDPALRAIHGAYPNPSTQMEAQSMDFGAVSQTDLTRVTFGPWRRLVRSGSQSKKDLLHLASSRNQLFNKSS